MSDRHVGYVVSRFPKTTETFILREMQAVEQLGWHVDLFALARRRLQAAGVGGTHGGGACTLGYPDRFFSHRRDGLTGRMAAAVALRR